VRDREQTGLSAREPLQYWAAVRKRGAIDSVDASRFRFSRNGRATVTDSTRTSARNPTTVKRVVDTTVDQRFSGEGASAVDWSAARDQLRDAMGYQLTTVRRDGRPHQTTIAGVWVDDAFSFTTGGSEQKAHNLRAGNRHVIVTVGNSGRDGMDVILEGDACSRPTGDRSA
jgi:hypothetical protein